MIARKPFALFSGVAVKVALSLVLLAGVAFVAISQAMVVFTSVSDSLDETIDSAMPRIEASTEVIKLSVNTSNALAQLGAVETEADRVEAYGAFEREVSVLQESIAALPPEAAEAILPVVLLLLSDVEEMNAAIADRLEIRSGVVE